MTDSEHGRVDIPPPDDQKSPPPPLVVTFAAVSVGCASVLWIIKMIFDWINCGCV